MQAIVETLFDAVYLITVITLGVIMIVKSGPNKEYRLFGVMGIKWNMEKRIHCWYVSIMASSWM